MVVCIHLHTLGELNWDHVNEPTSLGVRGALGSLPPNRLRSLGLPLGVPWEGPTDREGSAVSIPHAEATDHPGLGQPEGTYGYKPVTSFFRPFVAPRIFK